MTTLYDQSYPQVNVAFKELDLNQFTCVKLLYEAGREPLRARCRVNIRDGYISLFLEYISYTDGGIVVYEKANRRLSFKAPETALPISDGAFLVPVPGVKLKHIILVAFGFHDEYFKDVPFIAPDHIG